MIVNEQTIGKIEVIKIKTITDNTFKGEVIESDIPVIAVFCTSWCSPCKMLAAVVGELEKQYEGKYKFVKLDVEENPLIAMELDIQEFPTVVLYKDGTILNRTVGYKLKQEYEIIFSCDFSLLISAAK